MTKEGPMQKSGRDSLVVANLCESLLVDLMFRCWETPSIPIYDGCLLRDMSIRVRIVKRYLLSTRSHVNFTYCLEFCDVASVPL